MERWAKIEECEVWLLPDETRGPGAIKVYAYKGWLPQELASRARAVPAWHLFSGIDNTGTAFEVPGRSAPQARPMAWTSEGYMDVASVDNCNSDHVWRVRREDVSGLELRSRDWLVPTGSPQHGPFPYQEMQCKGGRVVESSGNYCRCGLDTWTAGHDWPVCGPYFARHTAAGEGHLLGLLLARVTPPAPEVAELLTGAGLRRGAADAPWPVFDAARSLVEDAHDYARRARRAAHLARVAMEMA